jgi:hypothetical protein
MFRRNVLDIKYVSLFSTTAIRNIFRSYRYSCVNFPMLPEARVVFHVKCPLLLLLSNFNENWSVLSSISKVPCSMKMDRSDHGNKRILLTFCCCVSGIPGDAQSPRRDDIT